MKIATLIFTATVVIFSALSTDLKSTDCPSEVLRNYYELALHGKVNEALEVWLDCDLNNGECPNSVPVSGEETRERWTKQINKYKDKIVRIESETIENDFASVLVSLESENGTKTRRIYKFVRVKESWKIFTFSSPALEEADMKAEEI